MQAYELFEDICFTIDSIYDILTALVLALALFVLQLFNLG